MSTSPLPPPPELRLTTPLRKRWLQLRRYKDRLATLFIMLGGLGVILSVLMILFYLLYQVVPLLTSARIVPLQQQIEQPLTGQSLYMALDAEGRIGVRLTQQGELQFFQPASGALLQQQRIALPDNSHITDLTDAGDGLMVLALSDGRVLPVQRQYSGTNNLQPVLHYPLGIEPLSLQPAPAGPLAAAVNQKQLLLISFHDGQLHQFRFDLSQPGPAPIQSVSLPTPGFEPRKLLLMPQQSRLLALGPEGRIGVIPLQGEGQTYEVIRAAREEITLFELLPGRRSLMLGDQSGALSQWFFVPDEYNSLKLQQIRQYDPLQSAPKRLAGREQDNSFITLEQNGTLSVYSLTSSRALLRTNLLGDEPDALALSAYNSFLLMERNNQVSSWQLQAPHAEITLSSLWSEIWHEDYDEPGYIWQSSTNGTDSAAKYSLVPLVFGTLKAALYAMLMATPMAICGAIYTAYFMAPALRRKIKPMIEMMAAVPSVVLGFLAGLWLAPFMQVHLAAILLLVLLLPISILLFAFGWEKMPQRIRFLLPEGWDVILLLGMIPLVAWLAFLLAVPIEAWLFDGQLVLWLGNQVDISYDQRNALIVGIAMGFAIIPTLFSLTEDAIHAVPRHLSNGALALGATPWQALTWMILPAASAGIFSALMIGFGRAIGETMIVLMVTGNTPIMEMNIFEGMRTLAANIAIEMPESSVGSSHYRVLFLTALLLFLFTLVVNTIAELIRQQLRRKYRAL